MTKRLSRICGLLGLLLCPSLAHAADFVFVRPGDPERIFKADEALLIDLPVELAGSELNSLFLELDGVDVTQLITLNGRRVTYTPPATYAPGTHTLRLVRKAGTGKLVEINRWNFTVSGAPPSSKTTTASGVLDSTYSFMPVSTGPNSLHPKRHNLSSLLQAEGATQTDGWQLSARGNGYLNSEDNYNPAGEQVEVGEYLLSAEQASEDGSLLFRLGNHNIGADNLLMNGFYRRGASARADVLNGSAVVTGFLQDPAPNIGNKNASGIGDDNQRTAGVHATFRPIAALKDGLEIEGTAYTGDGLQSSGTSTGAFLPQNAGSGYQVGLRSVLWQDYLSMRLQHAFTDFDFDGSNTGIGSVNDEAQRYALNITPLGSHIGDDGRITLWNVELSYLKTGTLFESLITQFEESDREKYALNTSFNKGGTALAGEVAWVTNNVNDYSFMPTDGALNTWAQASYAPEEEYWGKPVFFLGGSLSDESRQETPAGYTGVGLDQLTRSINGGFSLSFEGITGNLNHTYTVFDDNINVGTDYITNFTEASVEFKPASWATLRPGLQAEFSEQAGGSREGYHASLGADIVFIPDTLWNSSNYSLLVSEGEAASRSRHTLETELTWLVKEAEKNSPGFALAVAGMYGNLTVPDTTQIHRDDTARVFLRLKSSAPFAYE